MTSKRNAGDVLADLEASEIADEAEQALAMTPEQRGAAIAAAGISRDELEARAAD